jgi:hypothetical protein
MSKTIIKKEVRYNIPISASVLHEQEYYNTCILLKKIKQCRSLSETNTTKLHSFGETNTTKLHSFGETNTTKLHSFGETNTTNTSHKTKLQDKQVSQSPIFKCAIRQGSFDNKREALLF